MKDYHINVFFSAHDGCCVADIPDLRYCSAMGKSPLDAVREVNKAKNAWLKAAETEGKPIPAPKHNHSKIVKRINEQLASGVPIVWIVDCEAKMVVVHRTGGAVVVLDANHEITGEDILPDFRCKVSEFFKMPGQE
jgi:predicted RNase H-like HicB family nuclease